MNAEEYKDKRMQLGLTQAELAARLGVSVITIKRREGGQTPISHEAELALGALARSMKLETADFSKANWSLSNTKLASDLGTTTSAVAQARGRYAPETVGETHVRRVKWKSVDWSSPTKEISKALGVKTAWVSKMRRKYAPETLTQRKS